MPRRRCLPLPKHRWPLISGVSGLVSAASLGWNPRVFCEDDPSPWVWSGVGGGHCSTLLRRAARARRSALFNNAPAVHRSPSRS